MNSKFKGNKGKKDKTIVTPRSVVEKENEQGEIGLVDEETGKVVFPYGDYSFSEHSSKAKSLIFLFKIGDNHKTTHIGIYNKLRDKILAENWKVVRRPVYYDWELLCLQNPSTGKFHLFNGETYGTKLDIFNEGYRNIKFLGDYIGTYFFALTDDSGKQALYTNNEGFITGFEYDDIEDKIRIFILTKGSKKTFILAFDKSRKKSKEYDDIKTDGEYIYCQDGENWDVYLKGNLAAELVFTVSCDDIIKIGEVKERHNIRDIVKSVFSLQKDGKSGLMERIGNGTDTRNLLDIEYDKLWPFPETEGVLGGDIICGLEKDGKLGLFGYQAKQSYNDDGYENKFETEYDHIEMIRKYNLFALYKGDICDIGDIEKGKILLTDVEKYSVRGEYIIYERENKKGIYCIDDGSIYFGYDDIVYLGNNLYMVEVGGKKGLLHCSRWRGIKNIITPKYKSIKVGYSNCKTKGYCETLFLALENITGGYELNILDLSEDCCEEDRLTSPESNIYNQIRFFDRFLITENDRGIYVYSYDGILIKEFSPDTKVFMDKIDLKGGKKTELLIVDDEYYVFINGRFILVNRADIPEYEYSYTSEYGKVGTVFHSESEYSEFVKKMRKLSKKDIDDIFIGLYERSPRAQEKYPDLIKKIGERN